MSVHCTKRPGATFQDLLRENRALKNRVRFLEDRLYRLETGEDPPMVLNHPALRAARKQYEDARDHLDRAILRFVH